MGDSAENDAPTQCPNCGRLLAGDTHPIVCLVNAAAEIERLRGARLRDPRTHGGNHAPLPEGSYLAPGFCDECDQTRDIPPVESVSQYQDDQGNWRQK